MFVFKCFPELDEILQVVPYQFRVEEPFHTVSLFRYTCMLFVISHKSVTLMLSLRLTINPRNFFGIATSSVSVQKAYLHPKYFVPSLTQLYPTSFRLFLHFRILVTLSVVRHLDSSSVLKYICRSFRVVPETKTHRKQPWKEEKMSFHFSVTKTLLTSSSPVKPRIKAVPDS